MVLKPIGIIEPVKARMPAPGGIRLNNFEPQNYLKKMCGFNILTRGRTVEGLADMNLLQVTGIRSLDRETASRVIASCRLFTEGLNIPRADFDRVVSRLSTLMLHGEEIYRDHIAVSRLAYMIGDAMGLSRERLKDIRIAGLLHDIGKAAGEGAERVVEMSSSGVHNKYNPSNVGITVSVASVKLFSVREKIDPMTKIYSVVNKFFQDKAEAARILTALSSGLRLNTTKDGDPIGRFYRLHNYFSVGFLKGKIDARTLKIIALHHILEGVNPLDTEMLQVELDMEHVKGYDLIGSIKNEISEAKKDADLWMDAKILIIADKFDALLRRSGMEWKDALSTFHEIIRRNKFVEQNEFNPISKVLSDLIRQYPGLIEQGK